MRATPSRLLFPIAFALLVAVSGACTRQPAEGEAGAIEPERTTTTVRVDNRSFENVVVYVIAGNGSRRRLGEMPGTSTRVFEIPRTMIFGATPLRFQVDPIGSSRAPVSQDIVVSPGDQVSLLVP